MKLNDYKIESVADKLNLQKEGIFFNHQCSNHTNKTAVIFTNNTFYCPDCLTFGGNRKLIETVKAFKTEADINNWMSHLFNNYEYHVSADIVANDYVENMAQLTSRAIYSLDQNKMAKQLLESEYGLNNTDIQVLQLGIINQFVLDTLPESFIVELELKDHFDRFCIPIVYNGEVLAIKTFNSITDFKMICNEKQYPVPCYNYTTSHIALEENIASNTQKRLSNHSVLFVCENELDVYSLKKSCNINTAIAVSSVVSQSMEQKKQILELASLATDCMIVFGNSKISQVGADNLAVTLLELGKDVKILDIETSSLADFLSHDTNTAVFIQTVEEKMFNGKTFLSEYIESHRVDLHKEAEKNKICEWIARLPSANTDFYTKQLAKIPKDSPHSNVDVSYRARFILTEAQSTLLIKEKRKSFGKDETPVIELADNNNEGMVRFFMQDYWFDNDTKCLNAIKTIYTKIKKTKRDGIDEVSYSQRVPISIQVSASAGGALSFKFSPVNAEALDNYERAYLAPYDVAGHAPQWQLEGSSPYTFKSFIQEKGKVNVNTKELYDDIKKVLTDYYYFKEPTYADILTAYIMMTYVYMLVESVPYLQLKGRPSSGKSLLVELLQQLTFNSEKLISANHTHIFRITHAKRCTLFLNEEEQLNNAQNVRNIELLPLLKDTYSKTGGDVPRFTDARGGTYEVTRFDAYCPKIVSGTKPVEAILRTRMIQIDTVKIPKEELSSLKDYNINKIYLLPKLQEIRNKLMIWSLTQFPQYSNNYVNGLTALRDAGVGNRDLDIWSPLYASMASCGYSQEGLKLITEYCEQMSYRGQEARERSDFAEFSQVFIELFFEFKKNGLNEEFGMFAPVPNVYLAQISTFEKKFQEHLIKHIPKNWYVGQDYYKDKLGSPRWTKKVGYIQKDIHRSDYPKVGYKRNRQCWRFNLSMIKDIIKEYGLVDPTEN